MEGIKDSNLKELPKQRNPESNGIIVENSIEMVGHGYDKEV